MPNALSLFAAGALMLMASASHATSFSANPAPELDALFQRTNGWIGADGAYSIELPRNKTLWLFSDTWIGTVRGGSRIEPKMINNSIAIQESGKVPRFYYRTNSTGMAESFVKPTDGRGFYWLFHGTHTRDGLFFFLRHVEIVKPNSAFGFRGFGTSMAHVKNANDPPDRWRLEQKPFPHDLRKDDEQIVFGSAVMKDKGYVYVYGNRSSADKRQRGMIVSRVREKELGKFDRWEFLADGAWQKDFKAVTPICVDAPSEASVSYWPAAKKYVFLYTQGLWGKMVLRTAESPIGPWSEPIPLFDAPEMKYQAKIFCYAGKAHPQLSKRKDELIATYASNAYDVMDVIKDARLYWPRFVRIRLAPDDL